MKSIFYMLFLLSPFLIGCGKNETKFFEDEEKNGLSIFSNKGYNLLTCNINNVPWKTVDRTTTGLGSKTFELDIFKRKTNTSKDLLVFTWTGKSNFNTSYITLHFEVDSSFTYKDFKTVFNGKRIIIDSSSNGYFSTNMNNTSLNEKGNGVILFQTAAMDINSNQLTNNNMVGLFSAKIENNTITDGRFDHALNGLKFNF